MKDHPQIWKQVDLKEGWVVFFVKSRAHKTTIQKSLQHYGLIESSLVFGKGLIYKYWRGGTLKSLRNCGLKRKVVSDEGGSSSGVCSTFIVINYFTSESPLTGIDLLADNVGFSSLLDKIYTVSSSRVCRFCTQLISWKCDLKCEKAENFSCHNFWSQLVLFS